MRFRKTNEEIAEEKKVDEIRKELIEASGIHFWGTAWEIFKDHIGIWRLKQWWNNKYAQGYFNLVSKYSETVDRYAKLADEYNKFANKYIKIIKECQILYQINTALLEEIKKIKGELN